MQAMIKKQIRKEKKMNLKGMVSAFAAMSAILGGTGFVQPTYADVNVEDVKCTQRYPWNGLVDIEYTIACDDPEAEIYVNPVGFNGDTGLTVFPTHFTGDGATNTVKAGRHTMVWDAKADLGNLFATKNFQIKMYAGKKLSPYLVVDLSSGPDGDHFPIRHSLTPNIENDTCRTTELWLRLIPPGTFMMGSPTGELGRRDNEDLHKVTITKPFYIGVFEVTYEQWYRVYGSWAYGTSSFALYPVVDVSPNGYNTIGHDGSNQSFIGIIRAKTGMRGFHLPTEAQWEYACRLGTTTALNNGTNLDGVEGSVNLNLLGRYYANGTQGVWNNSSTAKVGSYKPNAYGIYDMHGNVFELCLDAYNESVNYHLGHSPCTDPVCDNWSGALIARGGCWNSGANACRSGLRDRFDANGSSITTGFRLFCTGNFQQ